MFDVVQPRSDVLAGRLSDAVFAAGPDEVVAGTASATFGNPVDFFASTHPPAGIMGGQSTLVLIDEIARHLGEAEGRMVGGGTRAGQTTAFVRA